MERLVQKLLNFFGKISNLIVSPKTLPWPEDVTPEVILAGKTMGDNVLYEIYYGTDTRKRIEAIKPPKRARDDSASGGAGAGSGAGSGAGFGAGSGAGFGSLKRAYTTKKAKPFVAAEYVDYAEPYVPPELPNYLLLQQLNNLNVLYQNYLYSFEKWKKFSKEQDEFFAQQKLLNDEYEKNINLYHRARILHDQKFVRDESGWGEVSSENELSSAALIVLERASEVSLTNWSSLSSSFARENVRNNADNSQMEHSKNTNLLHDSIESIVDKINAEFKSKSLSFCLTTFSNVCKSAISAYTVTLSIAYLNMQSTVVDDDLYKTIVGCHDFKEFNFIVKVDTIDL